MSEAGPPKPASGLRAHPTWRLLTRGSFARYSAANFVSLVGSWGQRVAAGWLVWEWTGSGFWLGVLALADLAPVVLIGPFAGVLADRWPRLAVNRVIQALIALVVAVIGLLVWMDAIGLTLMITLIGLNGVLSALAQPARLSLVQELVPRADVGTAVAINSIKSNLARLIGPAVAASMIVHIHVAWVFFGNALVTALFVVVMGWLTLIPYVRQRLAGNMFSQIGDGFRYLATEPSLRLVLLVCLLGGVLVRALSELLPAFAARSFDDPVTGLASLTSSLAAGAVISGLTIGRAISDGAMMRGTAWAWAGAAACGCVFGWVSAPWLAMASICGCGAFIGRGMIMAQTFVQLRTPDEMRGRALSVHGMIARASPAIGAVMIGGAIDLFGPPLSVTGAALVFAVSLALMTPALLRHSRAL